MSKVHFYDSILLIDAPIEEVYDYLTKNEHILSWSNMTKDHIYANGEPLQYSYAGQKLQVIQEHRGKGIPLMLGSRKSKHLPSLISELRMRSER